MRQLFNTAREIDWISVAEYRWIFIVRIVPSVIIFLAMGAVKMLDLLEFPFWAFAIAPIFEIFINQPYKFLARRFKNPVNLLTINSVLDLVVITWGLHFIGGMNMFVMLMVYSLVVIFSGFAQPLKRAYFLANLAFVFYGGLTYLEYNGLIPLIPIVEINISSQARLIFVLLTLPCFNLVAFYTTFLSRGLRESKTSLQYALSKLQVESEDRLQVENALRESEEKYRSIFESLMDLFYQTDMQGRLLTVSPSSYRLAGYHHEEVLGRNVSEFYPYAKERTALLKKLLRDGSVDDYEITLKAKDGRHILSSVSSKIIYDKAGNPVRVEGIARDITSRKEGEELFKKLLARNEAILGAIPDIIMEVDDKMTYTWANKAGLEFFGNDVVGRSAEDFFEGLQDTTVTVEPLFSGRQEEVYCESWQRRKDGKICLLAWWCRVLKDEKGTVTGALSSARDITEAREAERRLLQSEQRYRLFIEGMQDGVGFVDLNENILYANKALCDIFGVPYEEILGLNLGEFVPVEDFAKILDGTVRRLHQERNQYEINIVRRDSQIRQVSLLATPLLDYSGEVIGSVGIFTDVTEIRKAEEEKQQLRDKLIRAQKMESLGMLAGGVAHDLNNILGPLVAYPEIIRMSLPDDSPIITHIRKIENSTERAVDIVQDLLTMARRGRYDMMAVNFNEVIENYLQSPDFAGVRAKYSNVEIISQLEESLSNIKGSPAHLSKVVMNLIINALEAMPQGGRLTIKTDQRSMDRLLSGFDNIGAGDYVILTVSDTGMGIDAKDIKHLFEPFYSKKNMGRSGSGLGLAIVYGVVKDHNGYVDIKSEVNVGSEFMIYLPVMRDTEAKGKTQIVDIRGDERILVVDDLEEQRELASTLLTSLGYKVDLAPEGRTAVEYTKHNKYDLLVLDMIMEDGFDGLDTYKEILKYHPGQKAIIASGFSQTDRVLEAEKLGVGKYIRKPYTMQKLGEAIREVLAAQTIPAH